MKQNTSIFEVIYNKEVILNALVVAKIVESILKVEIIVFFLDSRPPMWGASTQGIRINGQWWADFFLVGGPSKCKVGLYKS